MAAQTFPRLSQRSMSSLTTLSPGRLPDAKRTHHRVADGRGEVRLPYAEARRQNPEADHDADQGQQHGNVRVPTLREQPNVEELSGQQRWCDAERCADQYERNCDGEGESMRNKQRADPAKQMFDPRSSGVGFTLGLRIARTHAAIAATTTAATPMHTH